MWPELLFCIDTGQQGAYTGTIVSILVGEPKMNEQASMNTPRDWKLVTLDKLLQRRETLRRRYELFQDVLNVNEDDNARAWLEATAVEGYRVNEEIGVLTRELLEQVQLP
jgi:lipopolysaccharide biosynthesis protein